MNYNEYEKTVFDWLISKHNKDKSFTFSVRQKANKGSEKDYFIGTQKSNYFGINFWNMPVYYPGSSVDLINVIFGRKGKDFSFKIQLYQTKNPSDNQNKSALNLVQNLKQKIKDSFDSFTEGPLENKMEYYAFGSKTDKYSSVAELLKDLDNILTKFIPMVNQQIAQEKENNSNFIGHQFTTIEFESMISKLENRMNKTVTDDEVRIEKKGTTHSTNLNQILFGPPGTGKTFHTITKAIEIIDPAFFKLNQYNRKALKEKFDGMLYDKESGKGQITFTTFHQSMSYEDFIEGIKPKLGNLLDEDDVVVNKNEFIEYAIEPGIFKIFCSKAKQTSAQSINLDFDLLWKQFYESISNTKDEVVFKSAYSELKYEKELSTESSIKIRFKKSIDSDLNEGKTVFHVGKETMRRIFNESVDLTDPKLKKWVTVKNIVGAGRATTFYSVYKSFFEFANLGEAFNKKDSALPHVLIIDEINRGNVSQIFGELITLIEEDKRLVKTESLEITLPYSKEKFGVPANLYIIGTMNTADRSVEAIDTALRRRFVFEEMAPQPELVSSDEVFWNFLKLNEEYEWIEAEYINRENQIKAFLNIDETAWGNRKKIWEDYEKKRNRNELDLDFTESDFTGLNLNKMLSTINSRIEKLIDKDHQIGHAFFMKVFSKDELLNVFENKIIPLLQEYFYGDYGKIGLVLGKSFIEKVTLKVEFADFTEYDSSIANDYRNKPIYQFKDSSDWDFESIYSKSKTINNE
ncbi:MAG: AAA family ATPase [bacterium]|nr:AAA family ATPase [bacterium]